MKSVVENLVLGQELEPFLQCPKSGGRISIKDGNYVVEGEGSAIDYQQVDGRPVLVDFGKSILSERNCLSSRASSVVQRREYGGILSIAKRLVSPKKRVTVENMKEFLHVLRESKAPGKDYSVVLVVGGARIGQGMDPMYSGDGIKIIAFDIYATDVVSMVADAHQIPLKNDSVDAVVIQAVLEHVVSPQKVVGEIHRVLRMGGVVYSETPFLQQVHEGPFDFSRFTESGHRYLFRDFEVLRSGASSGPGTQMLWTIDYFFRSLFRSRRVGKIMKLACFWIQYLDALIPSSYSVDSASGVFFMGRKGPTRMAAQELVDYYQGAQTRKAK